MLVDRRNRHAGTGGAASRCVLVLPRRFELRTSPLPRECSTPELRQRRRGAPHDIWRFSAQGPSLKNVRNCPRMRTARDRAPGTADTQASNVRSAFRNSRRPGTSPARVRYTHAERETRPILLDANWLEALAIILTGPPAKEDPKFVKRFGIINTKPVIHAFRKPEQALHSPLP